MWFQIYLRILEAVRRQTAAQYGFYFDEGVKILLSVTVHYNDYSAHWPNCGLLSP